MTWHGWSDGCELLKDSNPFQCCCGKPRGRIHQVLNIRPLNPPMHQRNVDAADSMPQTAPSIQSRPSYKGLMGQGDHPLVYFKARTCICSWELAVGEIAVTSVGSDQSLTEFNELLPRLAHSATNSPINVFS